MIASKIRLRELQFQRKRVMIRCSDRIVDLRRHRRDDPDMLRPAFASAEGALYS